MKFDKVERERAALEVIRIRWQLQFKPLENVDGENAAIDILYDLNNSPVRWSEMAPKHAGKSVEQLLEDLENLYIEASEPWRVFKTVFECEETKRDFLRWPDGMTPARIQEQVRLSFWELISTSRFSVDSPPNLFDLSAITKWSGPLLTIQHNVSLCVMVCIKQALDAIQDIENKWDLETAFIRDGKPFKWLAQRDPEWLETLLEIVYRYPKSRVFSDEKIAVAWASRVQAERWLQHLITLNFYRADVDKTVTIKKSKAARVAAKLPRKQETRELTPEVVAELLQNKKGRQREKVFEDLVSKGVSESTIYRRLREAKKRNIVIAMM
jgi:hypothetical protein